MKLDQVGLACGLVLIGALRTGIAFPPLEWLGRISYSLYLLHVAIGHPLIESIGVTGAIAVSIAASAMTYVMIEKPAMRLGHRFADRFRFGVTTKLRTTSPIESVDSTGP